MPHFAAHRPRSDPPPHVPLHCHGTGLPFHALILLPALPPPVLLLKAQGHVPPRPRYDPGNQPLDPVFGAEYAQIGLDVRGRAGLLEAVDMPAGEVRSQVGLQEERGPLLAQGEVVEAREVASVDTLDERQRQELLAVTVEGALGTWVISGAEYL
jgi:hypothetical protein